MLKFLSTPKSEAYVAHQSPGQTAERLYEVSREFVAPVITGFAHHLLQAAAKRKIICAARDALGVYEAATRLKDRFDYPNDDANQLSYAYLSRNVIYRSGSLAVGRHLSELGLNPNEGVLLADIGMFGTIMMGVRQVLPKVEAHYLISRNRNIPGYADGPEQRRMSSLNQIGSNPAIHFLEDTFSGPIQSPTTLVESGGILVPDTLNSTYPRHEALLRDSALNGIKDYADNLTEPPANPDLAAIAKLDAFLLDHTLYAGLMVPHERH